MTVNLTEAIDGSLHSHGDAVLIKIGHGLLTRDIGYPPNLSDILSSQPVNGNIGSP
jgi:hypothetical protein